MSDLYARPWTLLPFWLWDRLVRALYRLHVVRCILCDNTGDGCDCGCADLSWEIAGGSHYSWCITYNGCSLCGRGV